MSNEEKKQRAAHQAFRKKWFYIQLGAIVFITLLLAAFIYGYTYNQRGTYIEYVEKSNVDYKVYLKDNDEYEEESLNGGYAYIVELIDRIETEFEYKIDMNQDNVKYKYSYSVDAQLEILDKKYNKPLYAPVDVIVEKKTYQQDSSEDLVIKESFVIDYNEYNDKARKFISDYSLKNIQAKIIVKMHINVVSSCEDFETDATDDYSVSLNIDLNDTTTAINLSATAPTEENKIASCNDSAGKVLGYKIASIACGILDAGLIAAIVIFVLYTRDKNTDYSSKVNRVLRNYRSYIQKINNEFEAQGYQILRVDTINELLEIRDTLQKPILFTENEDKTTSKFFILTEQIMYLFKIEVSGYEEDEVYEDLEFEKDTLNISRNHKNVEVEFDVEDVDPKSMMDVRPKGRLLQRNKNKNRD